MPFSKVPRSNSRPSESWRTTSWLRAPRAIMNKDATPLTGEARLCLGLMIPKRNSLSRRTRLWFSPSPGYHNSRSRFYLRRNPPPAVITTIPLILQCNDCGRCSDRRWDRALLVSPTPPSAVCVSNSVLEFSLSSRRSDFG